jgi:hypothetical protein
MRPNPLRERHHEWLRRVTLTIGLACGAFGTILVVSGTLRAIDRVDQISHTLAGLSHYIAERHAAIQVRSTALGTLDDAALVRFDTGVGRRLAEFRTLKTLLAQQTSALWWTQPLRGNLEVDRVEAERRAYLAAARATASTPASNLAMSLRMFDLHAQQLIQTVEAIRDGAEAARARAIIAADAIVSLSLGGGVLLIAYLLWHPVSAAAGHPAAVTLLVERGGHSSFVARSSPRLAKSS